jgi:hypothetical protein
MGSINRTGRASIEAASRLSDLHGLLQIERRLYVAGSQSGLLRGNPKAAIIQASTPGFESAAAEWTKDGYARKDWDNLGGMFKARLVASNAVYPELAGNIRSIAEDLDSGHAVGLGRIEALRELFEGELGQMEWGADLAVKAILRKQQIVPTVAPPIINLAKELARRFKNLEKSAAEGRRTVRNLFGAVGLGAAGAGVGVLVVLGAAGALVLRRWLKG